MDNLLTEAIILFENKPVRKVWYEGEWFFPVVDVIALLTESDNPKVYWSAVKKREEQQFTFCKRLKFLANDGKSRLTDAANRQGLLRIIQSIPSPKAEPFKLWLAQVGEQHIQETENPELNIERFRTIYRAKGYADDWIDLRLKSIGIRKELTDEWKTRGVKESIEYAILTAEIAKATFGLTPAEHKELKGLDKHNLRDHMTNLELIFTAFSEEATRQFTINAEAQGFIENQEAAQKGGNLAGKLRKQAEKDGLKVVSSENFLKQIESVGSIDELPSAESQNN